MKPSAPLPSYDKLVEHFCKIQHIEHALTFLQWDQLVMMPSGGNETRSESIAELSALSHDSLTSPLLGDLLAQAEEERNKLNETEKISLLEMEKSYTQAICIPTELVRKQSLAASQCEHGWRRQKKENDWSGFLKNFQEVVHLAQEEADIRQAANPRFDTPYDALLDLYCEGDSSDDIRQIFSILKKDLPPLIETICQQQENCSIPKGPFPMEEQEKLSRELMHRLGFDFEQGRLDISLHPFSTGDLGDQRITTRYDEKEFLEALLSTAHETGHASYENGLPGAWHGLPIGEARSMCIHESQSLLFEKHLFLSKPFFSFFTKALHRHFPTTRAFSPEQLWQFAIHVKPSRIRIEADEVTYPLHVILRFEIEQDLINRVITPEDIPELWDEKMQEYLGQDTRGNYREGCMQDIHWTDGTFGYFPSYTMGAVNSAQLFQAFQEETPDWAPLFLQGNTLPLRKWLHENVWSKASSCSAQEIITRATGKKTDAESLLRHLRERYQR